MIMPHRRRIGQYRYRDSKPNTNITDSTVVLTCCKDDSQSQWETPIFGPSQLGNRLTDFDNCR